MKQTPPFSKTEDNESATAFSEDDAVGVVLVEARRRVSALFATFSAVMKEVGIDEACRKVKVKDGKRISMIDLNEVRRIFQTISEAGQRAEYQAESKGLLHGRVRKFRAPAYVMELTYKRKQLPPHLAKPKERLTLEEREEKQKLILSLGRNWQRRYKRVHLVQCYAHAALVDKESDPLASADKKSPRIYVDRLTDLLISTALIAQKSKGEPIARYSNAAAQAVKTFRENEEHLYAPKWTLERYNKEQGINELPEPKDKASEEKTATGPSLKDWKRVKAATREDAKAAKRLVAAGILSVDRARQELYDIITEEFANEPEPPEGGVSDDSVSPVIVYGDTKTQAAAQNASFSPSASSNSSNLLSKSEIISGLDVTPGTYLNLSPEESARAMVEACDSVGATMYKTAFTAIYPLVGQAAELPFDERSEPRQKGVNMNGAELISRISDYIRRNQEREHNIAVRVWGPIFQVDDASAEFYERLKPYCFAAIQTSPKSWQVWISLRGDFVGVDGKRNEALVAVRDRFFKRCEESGESANGGAYNSIRMPGTLNIKEKHAPNFPRIQLVHVAMGHRVTPEELDAAGLLAPVPAPVLHLVNPTPRTLNVTAQRLAHNYFVQRAPVKEDGQPNLSRADASFVVHRLALGDSRWEVEAELRAVRDKAARRDDYVRRTLDAAENYLASQAASGKARVQI